MLVKYMGSADIRSIDKGETAGGQLSEGIPVDLSWDKSNNWVIDTSDDKYSGVPTEFWDILTEDKETFKDVTDLQRVPTNQHQQIFLGMKGSDQEATRAAAAKEDLDTSQAGADGDENANPAQSEASGGATTTTVGGSTAGGTTGGGGRGNRSRS